MQNISKEIIIKATAKIITQKGLENTTIDDIAKSAKIAKGSVYVYFKSKDELLKEAMVFIADEKINTLKKLLNKYRGEDKLKLLLDSSDSYSKNNPDVLLMNYALLLSSHKNLRSSSAKIYFEKYISFIKEIVKESTTDSDINLEILTLIFVLIPDITNILRLNKNHTFNFKNDDILKIFKLLKKKNAK